MAKWCVKKRTAGLLGLSMLVVVLTSLLYDVSSERYAGETIQDVLAYTGLDEHGISVWGKHVEIKASPLETANLSTIKTNKGMLGMDHNQPFINPIIEQRADPWVYRHTDGYYYFTASVPEYDRIEVRRAQTIQELGQAEPVVAWRKYESGPMSANIWAPEIHYIQGKWYIYYAAARTTETKDGLFDHRMFVLENDSENPLEGTWVEKGQIRTKWESFALDATTFEHRDVRYLVWAQKDPEIPGNSNLYISEMENPWTLRGEQVMITKPEYPWEVIGFKVNEGAAVLKKNGKIFISFSASATDDNYCMGYLTASDTADLLNPASWGKTEQPVFRTNEETGQYGPGHNSFTVSPDGTEDILVYHARNYKEIDGDPLYDPNRHTRAQILNWNEDGTPDFGVPVPDGENVMVGKK